jgi:hypothetical protein
MTYSTDRGVKWSKALKVNTIATAIFPRAVALAPGKIDVVYYGSPYHHAGGEPPALP